jgi:hypothetical protein
MEPVGYRPHVFVGRPAFAAHFSVPPRCVEPGHFEFTFWLLLRRVGGEVNPALAFDQGFVLDDDANAFFTTAENFAQLQVSGPSSQRADFD